MRAGVATEIYRTSDQRGFISRDKRKAIFKVPLVPPAETARRAEHWRAPSAVGLFDVRNDYFEQAPLQDPVLLARLRSEMEETLRRAAEAKATWGETPPTPLSAEMQEQLKSLGYLK
jgi:hypothetical protein